MATHDVVASLRNLERQGEDYIWRTALAAREEIERLRGALLECSRKAEALKHDCGMDPESPQAVRNLQYMAISITAHIALGTIRGPVQQPPQIAASPRSMPGNRKGF